MKKLAWPRISVGLMALLLFGASACTRPGVDGGGESTTNNGGVAWILMATMIIMTGVILWFILGREE
jgi:hypothetical protein